MVQGSPKSTILGSSPFDLWHPYEDLPKENLFRLIQGTNWDVAAFRANSNKHEASQWIVKKKNDEVEWRRLPIHQACICDPSPGFITSLLDAHPTGAFEKDNQGRLPIHLACIHGASTYVVYLLLTAYRESVQEVDNYGKLPTDYASTNNYENSIEVVNLLSKGPAKFEFGLSNKVKIQEMQLSLGRKLMEAENLAQDGMSTPDDSTEENVEIRLEVGDGKVQTEVLHSRDIIRELENKLEESLYKCSKAKSEVQREREMSVTLENKVQDMEQMASETERFAERTLGNNQRTAKFLEKEITVLSASNTKMKFAFDKMESAIIALEDSNNRKDRVVKKLEEELAEAEKTLRKNQEDAKVIGHLKEEIRELEEEKVSFETQLKVASQVQTDAYTKLNKAESDASSWKTAYLKQKQLNDVNEQNIEVLQEEKEQHLAQISEGEKLKDDICALEMQIKLAHKSIDDVRNEKTELEKHIEEHEQYQVDAEKRMDSLEENLWEESDKNKNLTRILAALREVVESENNRFNEMLGLLSNISPSPDDDNLEQADEQN